MPAFKSKHPDIDCLYSPPLHTHLSYIRLTAVQVPENCTIWDWLFDEKSLYSPLNRFPQADWAGYTDAATKEHLPWKGVKDAATHISTALRSKYGFQANGTISL